MRTCKCWIACVSRHGLVCAHRHKNTKNTDSQIHVQKCQHKNANAKMRTLRNTTPMAHITCIQFRKPTPCKSGMGNLFHERPVYNARLLDQTPCNKCLICFIYLGVLEEAEFYNIPSLVTVLKERINVYDKKNPKAC